MEEKKNTMENLTKEQQHVEFDRHRKEIEKIILGCRGIQSRQVHWSEAVPMVAMYMTKELQKLTASGSVAAPKPDNLQWPSKCELPNHSEKLEAELAAAKESIKDLLPLAQEVFDSITIDDGESHKEYVSLKSLLSRAKALLDKQ